MKISVIMPTYNDADSIIETLDSITSQSHEDWQLIIINDGSTDNVESVIKQYKNQSKYKDQIEYYYQENQDQLNAISNVLKYINGEYVYILHSDDLLPSSEFFEKMISVAYEKNKVDAFIGNLIVINEDSKEVGIQKANKFYNSDKELSKLMLWLGRNLHIDFMFAKKEVFIKNVKESYLTWNMPFWIKSSDDNMDVLNVENIEFPILKYRVHSGNYINNEIGKLNVINGELRTLTRLMKFYSIPMYKSQFYLYRIVNKMKLGEKFNPIYSKKEEKNKGNIIRFAVEKRFKYEYNNNLYLNSIVNFYTNNNSRTISIDKIDEKEFIYKGKDMRLFNKNLINNNLSNLYINLINEMSIGFDKILVDEKDKDKAIDITKFLNIYPYAKIEVRD